MKAIVALMALTAIAHADYADHPEVALRARFAKEIKCDGKDKNDKNGYWCPASKMGTEKLALPAAKSVFLGFTTRVYDDRTIVKELDRSLELAVLCLGTGKYQGKLVRIEEQDEARTKLMAPVRDAAKKALTGGAKDVVVAPAVYDELQDLCRDYAPVSGEQAMIDSSPEQTESGGALFKTGAAYTTMILDDGATAIQVGVFAAIDVKKAR